MKSLTSTCRSLLSRPRILKPTTSPSLFKPKHKRSFIHGNPPHSGPIVTKRSMLSAMGFGCLRHFHQLNHRAPAPANCKIRRFSFVRKCSNAASVLSSLSDPLVQSPLSTVVTSQFTDSNHSDAPQRSEEWFAQRRDKLTSSTFSTALGFWKRNSRNYLWKNKVFPVDGYSADISARDAKNWGVQNESAAVERYRSITGREVGFLGFATHPDKKLQWLGASPDGLLEGNPGGGILEVKCPYNKGKPEVGPWLKVPYYYMPQVQGQMEILDRDWVDLYCWTLYGSTIFRIDRDRGYWNLMKEVLEEFWFDNVVRAREFVAQGRETDVILCKPSSTHKKTRLVTVKSLKLAGESKLLCKETAGQVEFRG